MRNINSPSDDNIYFNVRISNNIRNTSSVDAIYNETRNYPLLSNPADYYFTILKARIPLANMFIFVFQVQEGINQSDRDLGIYSVSLVFQNDVYTEFVRYQPTFIINQLPKPPSQNGGLQDKSIYYYVTSFNLFLKMINDAYLAAYTRLNNDHPGIVPNAPYLIYDAVTSKISFEMPFEYTIGLAEVWYDSHLFTYLQGMPHEFYQFQVATPLANKLLILPNTPVAFKREFPGLPTPAINDYIRITQEFGTSSLDYWNNLNNITIKTTMDLRYEYESNNSQDGLQNFDKILLTYDPLFDQAGAALQILQYIPQSQYKYIDIVKMTPLREFNLGIFWTDYLGENQLINIVPGTAITLNCAFIKKSIVNNKYNEN